MVAPDIVVGLVGLLVVYGVGLRRLWRAGAGRGVGRGRPLAFAGGCVVLGVALLGPVPVWADELFAVHMAQHLALTLAAPPLLLAGRPVTVVRFALPVRVRRRVGRPERRVADRLDAGVAVLAVAVYVTTVLAWHVPALFEAAVRVPAVHALEHSTLLVGGLLFWAVLGVGRRSPGPAGGLAAFGAAISLGALGGGLALTESIWYGVHPGGHGLSPLEDQQLAGAIMWVPGGVVHVAAAVVAVAGWLRADERARRRVVLTDRRSRPDGRGQT